MFQMLDTFIGLVTIYLVLSLIVTALGEGFSTHLNLKGGVIERMLDGLLGADGKKEFVKDPRFIALCSEQVAMSWFYLKIQRGLGWVIPRVKGNIVIETVAAKAGVKSSRKHYRAPSYLPPELFVTIVLDMVTKNSRLTGVAAGQISAVDVDRALQPPLAAAGASYLPHLQELWQQANYDLAAFKTGIAGWFDDVAQRSYGWFKREVEKYVFIAGFGTALFLNADTLQMFKVLTDNPTVRNEFVDKAMALSSDFKSEMTATGTNQNVNSLLGKALCEKSGVAKCTNDNMAKALLPNLLPVVGWDGVNMAPLSWNCISPFDNSCKVDTKVITAYLMKLIGLFLTAAAISLGAPFWFDLLRKVVQVRGVINASNVKASTTDANPDKPTAMAAPAGKSLVKMVMLPAGAKQTLADFHANAFGYDPLNHFWAAQLSNLAYDPAEVVKSQLSKWGAEGELVTSSDPAILIDTQCVIARTATAAFISLRGTEMKLEDWLTDVKVDHVEPFELGMSNDCRVHMGFYNALFVGQHSAWSAIEANDMFKAILKRGLPIWISGHSLGGALAVLVALRLQKAVKDTNSSSVIAAIQTFGQPRVGNKRFADAVEAQFAGKYFRSVNHRDIVTRVPFPQTPQVWAQNHLTLQPLEYAHAGRVVFFDELGQAIIDPPMWFRTLDTLMMDVDKMKDELKLFAADHSMSLYLKLHDHLLKIESA